MFTAYFGRETQGRQMRMSEAQKQEIIRLVDVIYERNRETFDLLAKA